MVRFVFVSKRAFLSLGRNAVPADLRSLKRGENSSFENLFEKLLTKDAFVISCPKSELFTHLVFKNAFLDHLLFKAYFKGLET